MNNDRYVKKKLPLNTNYCSMNVKWYSTDSEDAFKKNKTRTDVLVNYTENDITYNMNSDCMRYDDFSSVDWENSYVIVGCSHVMGVGQRFEETVGEQLAKKLSTPVVNLGAVGAGNDTIYHNAIWALSKNPKRVIVLWSYYTRFMAYRSDGEFELCTGYDEFMRSEISNYIKKEYVLQCDDLPMKSILYREILTSFDRIDQFNFFDTAMPDYIHLKHKDYGRDVLHMGAAGNAEMAQIIFERLNEKM